VSRRDYAQAFGWFRKAADQGQSTAQNRVGLFYDTGSGVPQDPVQAAEWYRKAAEQGDTSAQLNLGVAYETGRGVLKDYSESYFWIDLSAAGKASEIAKGTKSEELTKVLELLDTIGSHLTATELSQARDRARTWLAAHPAKAR
jgi:TPR repeat protein